MAVEIVCAVTVIVQLRSPSLQRDGSIQEKHSIEAKHMMKQPAENPNATPLEERESAQRVSPVRDPAKDHLEIEAEALRLAESRGSDTYTNEEWARASELVHNRRTSCSKA